MMHRGRERSSGSCYATVRSGGVSQFPEILDSTIAQSALSAILHMPQAGMKR